MPHVLIIGRGTLLDEGMIGLLQTEPDVQVSSVTYRTEDDLIQRIAQLQPEVIVISETDGLSGCQIVDALYREIPLSNFRIILVQPDSNTLRVCEFVTASHTRDLLRLIRSNRMNRVPSMNNPSQLRRRLP